jgi:hypothetical protein
MIDFYEETINLCIWKDPSVNWKRVMKLIDSPILAHLRLIRFLAQSTLADWEYAVNCALTWAYWKMHNHILIQLVL